MPLCIFLVRLFFVYLGAATRKHYMSLGCSSLILWTRFCLTLLPILSIRSTVRAVGGVCYALWRIWWVYLLDLWKKYLADYEFIANHALTGHFGKTAQCWVQYFNLVYSKCSIIQSLLMTLIGDFSSGKCYYHTVLLTVNFSSQMVWLVSRYFWRAEKLLVK